MLSSDSKVQIVQGIAGFIFILLLLCFGKWQYNYHSSAQEDYILTETNNSHIVDWKITPYWVRETNEFWFTCMNCKNSYEVKADEGFSDDMGGNLTFICTNCNLITEWSW